MPSTIGYPKKRIIRSQRNLDLVARAKQLTEQAKAYRQSVREDAWRQADRQWLGEQWGDQIVLENQHDLVTVNVSFGTVNTILPYVTGSDPSFIVEPYGGKATPQNGRLLEALLNRLWRSNRMAGNQHLRRSVWDYLVYGDGYLKTSYTLDKVLKADGLTEADIANLWVDRLDVRDVWLDPSADGLHNSRFVVIRIFRSVEELQNDPRYRNTGGIEAADDRTLDRGDERPDAPPVETGSDRDKMVAVYEFYDLAARQLVVWTDQVDLPLQIVDEVTCPIVQIGNHMIPSCPYHMGEMEQIASLQEELNKTRTQMVEHRRRNAQKWLARKGALTPEAKLALQSEDVNSVVEVDQDRSLDDLVKPLEVPNLAADAYAIDQLIKGDIYEITGVNEYLRGAAADIRRTATEATIIEGATNVKTAAKLRVVEQAARQIGQLLLDTAAAVYPLTDEDEMSLILTGRDAQAVVAAENPTADLSQVMGATLTPKAAMFDGTYEVFVEQGSTELRNPTAERQKYENLLTLFLGAAPTLAQFGVYLNFRKLIELLLDASGVDDIDSILASPEAQPMQPAGMPGMPGQPQAPGYAGGLLGMQAAGAAGVPNQGTALPPQALPAPENSGMLPPMP